MIQNSLPKKPKPIPHIYLDHAATTPTDKAVVQAMLPYVTNHYGNPSSLHTLGVTAHTAVEQARKTIAGLLHTEPYSIFFTSGATESINTAILGTARANKKHGKHIITTAVEHPATLEAMKQLKRESFEITYLPVDSTGAISLTGLTNAIRPDTILISIMYANNEIGTIYPIADIGRQILKHRKAEHSIFPFFHVDASQATTTLSLDVEKLHADLLSFNGSKLYGPKGIGVLYKRKHVLTNPIMYGGGQEMQLRSGTENVPGIVGIATALSLNEQRKSKERLRLQTLQGFFWQAIQKKLPESILNGPELNPEKRLVHNLHITFPGVDAEALIIYLNAYGIYTSSGSACATGEPEASHVLRACGLSDEAARSSVRFTFGQSTNKKQLQYVVSVLASIVKVLRKTTKYEIAK